MTSFDFIHLDAQQIIIFGYMLYGGWAATLLCLLFGGLMLRAGRRRAAVLAALGGLLPLIHLLFWTFLGAALFPGVRTNDSNVRAVFAVNVISMYGPLSIVAVAFVRMQLKQRRG